MLVIRPLQSDDLEDLYAMAQKAGKGLTTLPADRELLQRKIDRARESFNQRCAPEAALYLFALEDIQARKTVGISGIEARVGLEEVFYNYRLSVTVNASKELGVHVRTPTLNEPGVRHPAQYRGSGSPRPTTPADRTQLSATPARRFSARMLRRYL